MYLMLVVGAAVVGYILSYVAYHYIETRDSDKDDSIKEAIGNIHLRSGLIAGLAAFVAMYFINRNNGGEGGVRVQKMDIGQPGF